MNKEPPTPETNTQKFWRLANEMKMLAGALVLLPFFGSQISSLINWGDSIYNLNDKLSVYATKHESAAIAIDALKYIDSAIRNEITALEFAEETQIMIRSQLGSDITLEEITDIQITVDELRKQRRNKILEQQRIRNRILEIDPTWVPPEE